MQCYHNITNVFESVVLGKVHCEVCCGGTKKNFILIPTIKYYGTYGT